MKRKPLQMVVLDGYTLNPGDLSWAALEALGPITVYDRTPPEQVVERAREADIILTNKTVLSAEILTGLPNVKYIAVLATGFNIIDIAAARERGIPVSNVPEYSTDSVAQHVLALVLELTNQTGRHDREVHAGAWTACPDFSFWSTPLVELSGLTLGIIGFGRIGRRVGEIGRALNMNILAGSRRQVDPPSYEAFSWASNEEVFARADVVSLHCPLTPETEGLVNASMLARMKPSAYLINTSRGGLINEADLAAGLEAGQLAGFAADVVSAEPIAADNPLLQAKNCIITPHYAWATLAARKRLMAATVENVSAFLAGSPVNLV